MTQLSHKQNQIRCEPEICINDSEFLVSKKQTQPRFSTFARVLVLFSLISLAHTVMSVPMSTLQNWTNKVVDDTVAKILKGESLDADDLRNMVNIHFPLGPNSLTADEIASLTQYYSNQLRTRLENAGLSQAQINSIVPQAADWFESALVRFKGS
ncbi:MAG: hypothetical protein F4039_08050 [Gammaproteobacteria bacterium]|nr:hypothetical protein [Gammaproteobacteria bacterium]MXX95170.1 hypothetical protein [Gammaproteobacteria bacterium]MYF53669.1 hypothetical protein [Gammaproteobacteria bacterium]MYK44023.1 hypothetical protein [Gammaproteobacteria bacterium]